MAYQSWGKRQGGKAVRRAGGVVAEVAVAAEKEMSWAEIVEAAGKLEEEWRADSSLAWYRGHADASWDLMSTLHREVSGLLTTLGLNPPLADKVKLLRATYKTEYREFRSSGWPLLDQRERNDWGIVFAMQHYGQITRLLDWTESLACAAYFALSISCEKCHVPAQNAAIWMLDPQALNQESQTHDGLIALDHPSEMQVDEANILDARPWHPKYAPSADVILRTIAVAPDFTNARMTAQRAAFTMSGDSFDSLANEFPKLVQSGRLRKFVLTPNVRSEAAAFLRAAGLDSYSFYPDLHGLAIRHKDKVRRRLELIKKFYGHKLKK